ncbi:hypothetical protein F511_19200 [Dorcoceras hygrometricum]|uniref:Uncharacterized protein n=1 Tax=Dorcoceras hygrometricum TaxID=472368 RepID=A0A2Z7AGN6_9LAMI|nr:hypothetical protein F511_19200 [Dorcoceras hygrometricum]
MSSPSNTPVSSTDASIDSESPISQAGEPWLPEPEELPTTPWYEEKASTLRISDISIIKENGGTMGKFEAPTPPTPSSEEPLDVPPVTAIAGALSSGKGPERPLPFDPSKDSLVESPSAVAATGYICNMAPDRDRRALRKARNVDVVGHFSTNLAVDVAWGGELVKRLTQTYQKLNASREQFDRAMGQHAEVLARLEELEAHRAREEGEAKVQRETLEAQLAAEKEAHEAEKAARALLEAALEEVKARAGQEAERLKIEFKEEFLKSPEFDTLLGKKVGGYFKNGFRGCLAQWRANGYSEEEHPATFLDVQQAIIEMANEEEEGEEEEEEEGDGGVATRGGASVELGFSAERVGLICLCRRATRMASAELGFAAQVGLTPEEASVWNWALVPSGSGLNFISL